MKIEQIYTSCLSQASYFIENNGEAIVIDPIREVDQYIEKAKSNGCKIKYVFQTHFHADFVSGHITLSKLTNAPIVYGPNADPDYECIIASDGDFYEIGKIKIKVLHTPGHTLESCSYLLYNDYFPSFLNILLSYFAPHISKRLLIENSNQSLEAQRHRLITHLYSCRP